jgi:co-chaperonin GroES (HSP10)
MKPELCKLQPRGDFVVVKIVPKGETASGIKVSESSLEGQDHIVVAKGPKVEDLEIGDVVMMTGRKDLDWSLIPKQRNLMIIRESNIVLKFPKEEGQKE